MRCRLVPIAAAALLACGLAAPPAAASPARVAALQAALKSLGLYPGHVDGIRGPLTRRGVIRFQRRRDLAADGIVGPRTRRALGWRGRPGLGSRVMRIGNRGWDVAALQFLLQRAGHGPGRADGVFGPLTHAAVLRAQRAARVAVDGLAGPVTIRSLRHPARPVSSFGFARPVSGPIGSSFGAPRPGGRRHEGVDFPVPYGTRVGAAAPGRTIFAGYNSGGYGNLVVVAHRGGLTTWYAHLSTITSWVGERVRRGTRLGYVGSTGYSTGPHLHFEVRRYDSPIDPVGTLLARAADRRARPLECVGPPPRSRPARPGGDWIARERLC